jgi:hypothetical protein
MLRHISAFATGLLVVFGAAVYQHSTQAADQASNQVQTASIEMHQQLNYRGSGRNNGHNL